MDKETLAVIIQEGSRVISMLMRNRDLFSSSPSSVDEQAAPEPASGHAAVVQTEQTRKATAIATGCVPCSLGHLGTCTGLLNEAMRFARTDGVGSDEVISRVNMCMDELNALERVDLRPEMLQDLPPWEKDLAEKALALSRSVRHGLEGISDVNTLETVAAQTQTSRQEIGRAYFKERLSRMTPEQQQQVKQELQRRVEQKEQANEQSA